MESSVEDDTYSTLHSKNAWIGYPCCEQTLNSCCRPSLSGQKITASSSSCDIFRSRREQNIQKMHSNEKEDEPSSPLQSPLFLVCLGVFVVLAAGTIIYMSVRMTVQQGTINDLTREKNKLIKERAMTDIHRLDQISQEGEELFRNKEVLDRVRAEMSKAMEDIGHLSVEKDNFLLKRDKLSQVRKHLAEESKVKAELSQERHELNREKDELTRQINKLSQEREELKETLEFIQKFDTFSVKDNCPNKICKPCTGDWILFRQKCYLFYDKPGPWKTWEQSRRLCQDRRADLVIIDDLEEQEFVSKNIKYYSSEHHGYWMGLQEVSNTWTWINGRADSLGFWMKQTAAPPGSKALVIPRQNPSESWKIADNEFMSKFICERNARLRSN